MSFIALSLFVIDNVILLVIVCYGHCYSACHKMQLCLMPVLACTFLTVMCMMLKVGCTVFVFFSVSFLPLSQ